MARRRGTHGDAQGGEHARGFAHDLPIDLLPMTTETRRRRWTLCGGYSREGGRGVKAEQGKEGEIRIKIRKSKIGGRKGGCFLCGRVFSL